MKIGFLNNIKPFFGEKSEETKKAQIESSNNDNKSDQLCISKEARKLYAGEARDSKISAHIMNRVLTIHLWKVIFVRWNKYSQISSPIQ